MAEETFPRVVNVAGIPVVIQKGQWIFSQVFAPDEPLPSPADALFLHNSPVYDYDGRVQGNYVVWLGNVPVKEEVSNG